MQRFMISFTFLQQYRQEIFALVPQEQERAGALHKQGIVEAIYLSDNSTVGWLVMCGDSQAQVQEALNTLPLYSHGYIEGNFTPLSDYSM